MKNSILFAGRPGVSPAVMVVGNISNILATTIPL
jgi:hypothetical protein